jgi:hypothetical protein
MKSSNPNPKPSKIRNLLSILSNKKADMTMSQLIMIIIGLLVLAFIFFVIFPSITSGGDSWMNNIFGKR